MKGFKKKAVAVAVGSALGLALTSAPAQAAPTYNGCASSTACTLQELFDGASIVMNNVVFGGFSLGFSSGNVAPYGFSSVFVTGDDSDGMNLGLLYGGFSIVGGPDGVLDYSFTVDASPNTGLILGDASLELTNAASPVEIVEDLFDAGDNFIDTMTVFSDDAGTQTFDSTVYAATDFLGVDMALAAGGAGWVDGFETYFSLDPQATDVPEPGTLALLGAGLVGFGLTRRRKKKA